ncbi:MAG: TRAP transporter large permease subunit, partial [Treponema sp.]|jgi:tripartite ATP-independent transporter DctM subunit|nr:TRAP transporter large permease subunit [Treponema sp.]
MICTRKKEHLSIAIVQYIKDDRVKYFISVASGFLSAFTCTIIAWSSVSFLYIGLSPWTMIGFIPDQIIALIMPLGYLVMAVRFARSVTGKLPVKILVWCAILLGTLLSFPVISKVIWGFDSPDWVFNINDTLVLAAGSIKIPAVIFIIAAALLGTPLFVVMGALSFILIQSSYGEIDVVSNQIYTALTQSSIIPLALFTLVGFFLSESKAGERLVLTFKSLFSWIPGGMIIATVIICAFFTSFTGASGVTILALGGLLFTILNEKSKYPEKFTVGLLTSVGGIGLLFPPSLPLILVGAATMTNTIHLFAGGIIPGFILVLAMIIFGIVASINNKIPVEKFEVKKALSSLKVSVWEILLPILLVAGFFTGILSTLEIGAAAVVYVFFIEVIVHRDIKLKDLPKVFSKAIPIIGGVLSILALSQALSYYIIDTQAPQQLAAWMAEAIQSKYVFLLLLNLALLVVGCLMDIFSAIVVVLPLIVPLGQAYGIDPVHLGVIFVINMEVGFLTPPVGMNLFLATYRFKKPFLEICKFVVPFLLVQLIVVLLVTYVPALSTWIPSLLK